MLDRAVTSTRLRTYRVRGTDHGPIDQNEGRSPGASGNAMRSGPLGQSCWKMKRSAHRSPDLRGRRSSGTTGGSGAGKAGCARVLPLSMESVHSENETMRSCLVPDRTSYCRWSMRTSMRYRVRRPDRRQVHSRVCCTRQAGISTCVRVGQLILYLP